MGRQRRYYFLRTERPLTDPFTYVRFFGHVFGYASITHFFNNMLLLLVVGPPLEELYGSKTLISGILATAVISGLLQFILSLAVCC